MELVYEMMSPHTKKLMSDAEYKFSKHQSLLATHYPQRNHLITLPRLQLFKKLSMHATD